MTKQHIARFTVLPDCDLCKLENPLSKPQAARYDAPIAGNGWAYLCCYHYKGYAVGLGTKLVAEDSLESGAVEQEIVFARQRLAEEGV
ncbi:hypothetical protein LCGC14_0442790 [marine sediment metagenome]|uniref:Uncharacterized protein n=1 Tax=marine sediment metagenome TaxID=412755 RepID=A0A0F9SQZ9_9ZZZZ